MHWSGLVRPWKEIFFPSLIGQDWFCPNHAFTSIEHNTKTLSHNNLEIAKFKFHYEHLLHGVELSSVGAMYSHINHSSTRQLRASVSNSIYCIEECSITKSSFKHYLIKISMFCYKPIQYI